MDLSSILEVLGINDLGSMSCNDLKDKIKQASLNQVPRHEILATLMGWLHEQIKKDVITQEPSTLQDFVHLLTVPDALDIMPFSESEIGLAFDEWQMKDSTQNPANRRRYSMARLDLNNLLERTKSSSQLENILHSSNSPGQAEGGEQLALSVETTPSPFLSEIQNKESNDYEFKVGKKKTGANVIPLGTRKPLRTATKQDVIEIFDDDEPIQQPNGPASCCSDIDEVTITRETILLDSPPQKMAKNAERGRSLKHRHSQKHHTGNGSVFSAPPPANYVCKRCSQPGHWIQLCPTNLDPSYDRPPEPNYRCELCGRVGDHFATLCPRNDNEISLTKKRQRMASGSETPLREDYHQRRSTSPMGKYHRGGHDIYRPDRSPRARYDGFDRHARRPERGREISPYSARARLTREQEKGRERTLRTASPRRPMPDHYRPICRSSSPLRCRQDTTSSSARILRLMADPNKPRNGESREGRLAYDDDIDIFTEPSLSLRAPARGNSLELTESIYKGGSTRETSPIADDDSDDIERARREADAFLDALGIEIMASMKPYATGNPMSTDKVQRDMDGCGNLSDPDASIFEKPDGREIRRIEESPFQEEAINIFTNRDNPVVHGRTNRRMACETIGTP
ncbi:hypothetical protein F4810DRAFT_718214 [Camillea tinctor]|nr:hypothetical protein F4810DRAFT_718214 [Camillea tinctor]